MVLLKVIPSAGRQEPLLACSEVEAFFSIAFRYLSFSILIGTDACENVRGR